MEKDKYQIKDIVLDAADDEQAIEVLEHKLQHTQSVLQQYTNSLNENYKKLQFRFQRELEFVEKAYKEKIEMLEYRLEEKEKEHSNDLIQLNKLKKENEKYRGQADVREEWKKYYNDSIHNLKNSIDEKNKEIEGYQRQMQSLKAELFLVREENAKSKTAHQEQYLQWQSEKKEIYHQLDKIKREQYKSFEANNELCEQIKRLQELEVQLRDEMQDRETHLREEMQENENQLRAKFQSEHSKLSKEFKEKLSAAHLREDDLQTQVKALEKQAIHFERELEHKQVTVEDLTQRNIYLEKKNRYRDSEIENYVSETQALKQKILSNEHEHKFEIKKLEFASQNETDKLKEKVEKLEINNRHLQLQLQKKS